MHHAHRPHAPARSLAVAGTLALALLAMPGVSPAVDLADQPLFSTVTVPGNVLLALSVEFPTALSPAYPSSTAYSASSTFIGYFDPQKCYRYAYNSTTPAESYFYPYGAASSHACTSTSSVPLWSGNYLNWASMGALDTFRKVMTGGYRATDSTTSTILEKSYNYNTGVPQPRNTPDKTITGSTTISGATPFTWGSATTKVWHQGAAMLITGSYTTYSNSTTNTCYQQTTCVNVGSPASPYAPLTPDNATSYYYDAQTSAGSTASAAKIYKVYIRVKVCDSSVGVESNCVLYGSNYKPEGLMQTYASKLRFSALGYLNIPDYNDTNRQRDGGVLRARMKYIGPTQPVPGSSAITNSAAEWSSSTGVMVTNPDATDASTTISTFGLASGSVPNSGVMNYLNKFGTTSKDYKTFDPISELYYAGLRYYKNGGNVDSYSTGTTKDYADGFPVITSWDDPIAYTCQKNFILGIGDTNTGPDRNLYGATNKSTYETSTTPATMSSVDVNTATNMVGTLEGISSLGSTRPNGSTNAYYIAGLAYDAHTVDIRSDLTGTQLINTYWLDVWEYQTYTSKNQYWLAAKYGGFTVPDAFSPYATTNSSSTLSTTDWHTGGSTDLVGSDYRPDNYYAANQADKMSAGLSSAFAKIVSETESATSTALSTVSPNVTSSSNVSYAATYDPANWTGQVIASTVTYASDGTPTLATAWDARSLLSATSVTASTRKIVTCCTSAGAALPFTSAALSAATLSSRTYLDAFASIPNVASASQSSANYIAYLRGDTAQEVANGGVYRTRKYRLGDIVNAKPVAVGTPSFPYYDVYNPGYSSFKTTYASRKTVVYAGANDGMLHAFDGTTGQTASGSELFAYIPSFVYGSASTATTSGLAALGNTSFTHHYYVDATPISHDVDLSKTYEPTASTRDWRTLLIGGLGKGGAGYYAIDITNPTSWTDETTIAGKVLWEFTDSRMGYSYGKPSVVKTAKYGWVVVFTSGYNNSDGIGYFFIVNPRNGALLEAVATPTGSTSSPVNLGEHTAFVANYADMTADAVYAGDLAGNVWRLDLTGKTGSYGAPTLIATLANASGTAQPVTTRPLVEIEPNSKKRYVMIGTGKLLADSDISSSSVQSFYAIVDGTGTSGDFYTSSSLPSGASFPVTRSQLQANTSLRSGIGSSPASVMGWYFDLPVSSSIAQRVDVTPTANSGIVAFVGNLPNGQACTPGGVGTAYAVSFATGTTVLTDTDGSLVVSTSPINGVLTDVAIQRVNGKLRLYIGGSDSDGNATIVKAPANLTTSAGVKQLNWREVLQAD